MVVQNIEKFSNDSFVFLLCFFKKKDFFLMWTIFKVFNEFVKILLLLFMFWFFGHEACEIAKGNGNPLQYTCPENPMDRGAW